MIQRNRDRRYLSVHWATMTLVALILSLSGPYSAQGRIKISGIIGAEGNQPLRDPGWPDGAPAIFNHPGRIAWWEGPPFGGGQYHSECRGDAKSFTQVLSDFAKLQVKSKRLIVRDGVGRSFWLNPNRKPEKQAAAEMDWRFMVWVPDNWQRLRQLPADLNPTKPGDPQNGPPAEIEVFTGGKIRWSDVTIPDGITVIDKRLETHGFSAADGVVLQGQVRDHANQRPIAAKIQLQLIQARPGGGHDYTNVSNTTADQQGHWVLKHVPAGWHRIVVSAAGHVPRIVGHIRTDEQPQWHQYNCQLSSSTSVSGQVTDQQGNPLSDVAVRLSNVVADQNDRYESTGEYTTRTDDRGVFQIDNVPQGSATIWVHKAGYFRPGLGQDVDTPIANVSLQMQKSATVTVTVDFSQGQRPNAYIVNLEPEGGVAVGKWSGSGSIDENNQRVFRNVPPGRYVLQGHPNPHSANQKSEPITIELAGGQSHEVTLLPK